MPKTHYSKHASPRMRVRTCPYARRRTAGSSSGYSTSAVTYPYDANGAMLSDGLRHYEFDAANRLANVTTGSGVDAPTTRYVHNALGQRLFKTEPQYAPVSSGSNPSDPGVMQTLATFFASLWGGTSTLAAPSASDKLGFQYYYGDTEGLDGSLLYEQGTGGANSTGSVHYIYLPTPAGPMPIATYTGNGRHYAVHTDHLNTPRRLTQSNKQVAWQWAFSAFGDEQPTTAKNRFVDPATTPNAGSTTVADVTFNLRYPGQYFDKESNLHYNWMRSYDPKVRGGYTQPDPIDLAGGWNKFSYAYQNPLRFIDPSGLDVLNVIGDNAAGIPYGRPGDQYDTTFTITKPGVCDGQESSCAAGMRAAGLQGPFYSSTKRYDAACILGLGVVGKGGGVVVGNAIASQVPRAAAAAGASARVLSFVGRGVAVFTNPVTAAGSLGFAIPTVFDHCEIKPPMCEAK
jgi:RHS repeat-associated protein